MSSILTANIKKTPLISEITKNNDTEEEEEDENKIVIEDVTNLQQQQQQSSSKALSADTISKELQNLDFNTMIHLWKIHLTLMLLCLAMILKKKSINNQIRLQLILKLLVLI